MLLAQDRNEDEAELCHFSAHAVLGIENILGQLHTRSPGWPTAAKNLKRYLHGIPSAMAVKIAGFESRRGQ
jgi:hypothetical protein